jgi:hypothetical protein
MLGSSRIEPPKSGRARNEGLTTMISMARHPAARREHTLRRLFGDRAEAAAETLCLRMIERDNAESAEKWGDVIARMAGA